MSLLDDVSIVVTPNGYKAGELYAVIPVPTEGAEEITNGDFSSGSTGWTIINGTVTDKYNASMTAYQSGIRISPFSKTGTYKVSFDLVITSGSCKFDAGGGNNQTYSTSGTKEILVINTSKFEFNAFNLGWVGTLDNVSVKEWTGADMDVTRGTAATRVDENGFVNYAEVIGSDLITNGDFTSNIIGWGNALISTVPDIVWNNGKARITNTTGSNYNTGLNTTNNPFNGLTGIVKVTGNIQIISGTASSFKAREHYGTVASFVLDASGDFEVVLSLNGTSDDLAIYTYTDDLVFDIDNIVAKEIQRDNVPRIDYTGGGCPHILAEPERTNLVTYSVDIDSYFTSQVDVTFTNDYETSPTGDNNSTRVQWADSTSFAYRTVSVSTDTSASIFVKGTSGETVMFGFGANVTTGTVYTFDGSWQRITFTGSTGTTIFLSSYGGATATDFQAFGLQLEVGSYATSYIPTSGSTVTRNQDIFTRDGIGSLINSQEGVLFLEIAALSNDGTNRAISISDGTLNNRIFVFYSTSSNQVRVQGKVGNVVQFSFTESILNATNFIKLAIKYKENDFALWLDGVEVDTDSSGVTFPADTLNELQFAVGGTSSRFFGKVKQLQVYESALTDEQLLQLTGESGTDFYESYAEMASALTYTIQ